MTELGPSGGQGRSLSQITTEVLADPAVRQALRAAMESAIAPLIDVVQEVVRRAGPRLLTASEVAAKAGISEKTFRRLRSSGRAPEPAPLPGGILRWDEHVVEAWLGIEGRP